MIRGHCLHLTLPGRDNRVAGNEFSEDSTGGFDTKRERADVNKDDAVSAFCSGKNAALNGGTISHGFVRVNPLRWFLAAEELLEELLYLGNTRRATNKDDLRMYTLF